MSDEVQIRLANLARQPTKAELVMTEKNRRLLRQLGPADMAALYCLPNQLMASVEARRVRNGKLTYRDIQNARAAVSLALLLYTPPRITNFAMIRLGKHLTLPSLGGGTGHLQFAAGEMKGKRPWATPINSKSLPVVIWYVNKILPRMGGSDPMILFPGKRDHLSQDSLRNDIYRALEMAVRCRLNPHFFRHLVAHVLLVRNPGEYALLQQLLGHADVETTRTFLLWRGG